MNKNTEMIHALKPFWLADVEYSYMGFICFMVIFHFYLKYRHAKKLQERKVERRYSFDWEENKKKSCEQSDSAKNCPRLIMEEYRKGLENTVCDAILPSDKKVLQKVLDSHVITVEL